jgi:hypothetical protein
MTAPAVLPVMTVILDYALKEPAETAVMAIQLEKTNAQIQSMPMMGLMGGFVYMTILFTIAILMKLQTSLQFLSWLTIAQLLLSQTSVMMTLEQKALDLLLTAYVEEEIMIFIRFA